MTTHPDVTAADLAEALREAVANDAAIGWIEDLDPAYDPEAPDRYDAQERKRLRRELRALGGE